MEKLRTQSYIPFDLYDFFGYLFPGLMVLVYIVLFEYLTFPSSEPFFKDVIDFVGGLPWFVGLFFAIVSILVIYVVGHLVGAISSIVFDRILIEGIYGYPAVNLLGFNRQRREFSEATHRYLFLSLNLFLAAAVVANDRLFNLVTIVLMVIVGILFVLRVIIKWIKVSGRSHIIPRFSEHKIVRTLFLTISDVFAWFEENVLKALLGMDKPFPEEFRRRYIQLFEKTFRMDPKVVVSENYWLSYLYAVSANPSYISLLKTWLHLYGFARNISTATFLCLFAFSVTRFFYPDMMTTGNQFLFGFMLLTAWVFMARYWMLYQSYHTKNVLRAFVASAQMAQSGEEGIEWPTKRKGKKA